jgi:hypothetical protein
MYIEEDPKGIEYVIDNKEIKIKIRKEEKLENIIREYKEKGIENYIKEMIKRNESLYIRIIFGDENKNYSGGGVIKVYEREDNNKVKYFIYTFIMSGGKFKYSRWVIESPNINKIYSRVFKSIEDILLNFYKKINE